MAFHEIAVDPSAIRNWRDFQLVWGKCGFHKGRLIAGYPDKGPDKETREQSWAWRVIASVKEHDVGSAKRVQTAIEAQAKSKMIKKGRVFDHAQGWTSNAAKEHRRQPFAALVGSETTGDQGCCTLDDFEGDASPSCLRDDQHVMSLPKQPADLAEVLLPMLRCAKDIRFVDPYFLKLFDGRATLSRRHAQVIQEIAARLEAVGRVPQNVEFHMVALEGDPDLQCSSFATEMGACLPKRWSAKVFLWREALGSKRFHARYILTDVGGVGSEYGWDKGTSPSDETDLYLLTEGILEQRTRDFSEAGATYALAAAPFLFSGIRG
jgi:hypothetical protein